VRRISLDRKANRGRAPLVTTSAETISPGKARASSSSLGPAAAVFLVLVVGAAAVMCLPFTAESTTHGDVTRVDVARAKVVASIPVPVQIPFGIAWYRGSAWVAGAGRVIRIDPSTNRPGGTVTLNAHSLPVFTQVAAGPAGLWATDYDEGVLYRLRVP
jgi:hypothetical protein